MQNRTNGQVNDAAVDAFLVLIAEIIEISEAIRFSAEEHFDTAPEEVHWGHVGDARWTRDQMAHVLKVIRGEEGK